MTHACFHDATALVDALAAKPDRTPDEECALHVLQEQADAIDKLTALVAEMDRDHRRQALNARAAARRAAADHAAYRIEAEAHILSLRHRLAATQTGALAPTLGQRPLNITPAKETK